MADDLYDRLLRLPHERLALLALEQQEQLQRLDAAPASQADDAIAVVGLACRVPGARNAEEYWDLLRNGRDAITEITPDRWDIDAYYDPDVEAPGKMVTRWAGLIDDVDRFDAAFFGISPREARSIDPQQRQLLEVTWEAFEHAGIVPESLHGTRTGTYVGICNGDFGQMLFSGDERDFDMYVPTGNASSVASGRLSYVLGLAGPAITVDTACSSSLVATHLAVQGLRSGDCDVAVAAGSNVILRPETTIALSQAKMMAPDGRCKPFDSRANGFVRGEGCAVVVLKRLADADAAGDRILGIIRGSAVNQDGRSNGLTAPNGPSQVSVIKAALADADITPDQVGYVEAHGTGTPLGDPIEVQALGAALGGIDRERLLIGSAKSNIGHLESAAGVAGLIKVVLAMHHGEVPPSINYQEPNPLIPWSDLPIDVVTDPTPWPRDGRALGGVSSFGFSGTNAHLVLEPAPSSAAGGSTPPAPQRPAQIVTVSATTPESLDRAAERIAEAPLASLDSIANASTTGRTHHPERLAIVASDGDELRSAIDTWSREGAHPAIVRGRASVRRPNVAFLFTGHGSHYARMGQGLTTEPAFRSAMERCAIHLATHGVDLDAALNAPAGQANHPLDTMTTAQPALFALEYALAELWSSWGVRPDVVVGHSIGEYVAAVVSGVMSVEAGLDLVATRGRLMDTISTPGAMVSVLAPERDVLDMLSALGSTATIAAINGPASVAVSGTPTEVDELATACAEQTIEVRRLDVPIAAHSAQVEPILDEFETVAARASYASPTIPIVSARTGALAHGDDLATSAYWRRHLREPVRFADAFTATVATGATVHVELGPHPTLLNMGRHIVDERDHVWLPSLRNGHDDHRTVLGSLARLHTEGSPVDWAAHHGGRIIADLPHYPFEPTRHWAAPKRRTGRVDTGHPLLGRRIDSPRLDGEAFELELDVDELPWLDEHRIHGVMVVPAPVVFEMVTRAVDGRTDDRTAFADVTIHEPLIVPDEGAVTVQVLLADAASTSFEVVSRLDPTSAWRTHVTGTVAASRPALTPATASTISEEAGDIDEFYDRLRSAGLALGASFTPIVELAAADATATARLERPASLDRLDADLHPAMADACFHVLGAPRAADQGDDLALLVGIEQLDHHGPAGDQIEVRAELVDTSTPGLIVADLHVANADGSAVFSARGIRLRRTPAAELRRAVGGRRDDLVHAVEWHPLSTSDAVAEPRRVVIHGEASPLRAFVLDALDDRARLAAPDSAHGAGDATDVVMVFDAASDDETDWQTVAVAAAAGVADQLRSAERAGGDARVWVVTEGTQPVEGDIVAPHFAALWGLGRTAALEHPDRWGGCIDLAPSPTDADGATLAAVLGHPDEDQIAIRNGEPLVPRLVPAAGMPTPSQPVVRPDGTYLVTGGLGGLGLIVADWLAAQGAGAIVLTGRRGLPPRATWKDADLDPDTATRVAAVERLESQGATVVVESVDIADRAGMAALVERCGNDLPPLRGVLHAAAALDNATLAELTEDRLATMLHPKIAGTATLADVIGEQPVDAVVLFSSTTALLGSAQLGHYGAANAVLDAIAHARAAEGLPWISVNWGTWEEMRVASSEDRDLVERGGLRAMAPEDALDQLARAMAAPQPQAVVVDADWHALRALYETRRRRPFLDLATGSATRATARGEATLAEALREVDAAERPQLIEDFLRTEVATSLQLPDPRRIDVEQGLFEMGMDSLMSVELKSRIEDALGVDLPSTLTFNYPTIADLTDHLLERSAPSDDHAPATTAPLAPVEQTTIDDDLDEDELEALLAQRLANLRNDGDVNP